MKSLKKSVIAVLVIGTLSIAGTAFAYRGQGFNGQYCARRGGHAFGDLLLEHSDEFRHEVAVFEELKENL